MLHLPPLPTILVKTNSSCCYIKRRFIDKYQMLLEIDSTHDAVMFCCLESFYKKVDMMCDIRGYKQGWIGGCSGTVEGYNNGHVLRLYNQSICFVSVWKECLWNGSINGEKSKFDKRLLIYCLFILVNCLLSVQYDCLQKNHRRGK